MNEPFSEILQAGGKLNSLGRVNEVIEAVLTDQSRLEELYQCLFEDDAWVRMRAIDAIEKICRTHPDWLLPYIDKLIDNFHSSTQPSIQWHLAEIYRQVNLTDSQKQAAIQWMEDLVSTVDVDWIASANTMTTLVYFTKQGWVDTDIVHKLLNVQKNHKSKAVVRRADKLLLELS